MNNSATANNYLTNGTYGLNAINTNVLNTQNGINNVSSGVSSLLSSMGNLQTGVNSIQTSTNNIQNGINNLQNNNNSILTAISNIQNYMAPTISKVTGYNGASATSTTSFKVALTYSQANEFQYRVDNGSWSGWTPLSSVDFNGYFTASNISTTGTHTIDVQVRYNNGSGVISPVANGQMTMFKM